MWRLSLQTTLRAHARFEEIKNESLKAAERIDSSRMEEVVRQFDKSINGALNTAVMETLNQAAIDSRQAMVDQMAGALENNLGKSVQQALDYNDVLNQARTTLGITDAMFAGGFDGLSESQKEKLNNEIQRIFAEEKKTDDGFSVTQNANGNITVTRMIPTGNSIQMAGTDGTKPEHYKPELREESFVVTGPAAMKLMKTDGLFNAWDLEEALGKFGRAQKSYNQAGGKDVEKILNRTIKDQGEILNDRIDVYHENTQARMAAAQTVKSIVESMFTGGQDFKSAATNYLEGQVRGQIAAAVAEATGLPSEFISGLMGGQKPHEAAVSMAENMAWQNFERAVGIEGISTLVKTAMSNEQARKAEKKSKRIGLEDIATMGMTYTWRNEQYSGGLQTLSAMTNIISMASGVPLNSIKSGYLNAKTQQGPGAFSSLVNESLNGLTGNLTTVANSITTGRAPTRSQLQSLTGLPGNYFNNFPGLLKPPSDRQDIYGRLGTRNLGRWVDRVVDEGTKFGQDLASGKYFADSIGGSFGDTLKRRNSADFATAEDLTNVMFNPLDYFIKPMYEAAGMGRTYDNFWAPYKKFTRKGKEQFRDTLAKNPALLDVTAFAAANATGCLQCYYGYAQQKGWNQGGTKGAVAEVGTIVLKGLGALALGPAAAQGTSASVATLEALFTSLDAGASYSYENGWDVKIGLADPTGKLSSGLTYSDQSGVGIYANVSATKSKHGASLGFSYSEGSGLSMNAGGKRGGFNAGISYSATNGFGVSCGYTDDLGGLSDTLNGATGGLSFGLSQRGGWSMDATFSPEKAFDAKYLKERGTGLGIGYYSRPGQGGGFTASASIKGFSLEHDLKTGQSTVGDFAQMIRTLNAERRENEMRQKRLAEIGKRLKIKITADEWDRMSPDEQDKVLEEVEKAAKDNPDGAEGESYDTDGGLLGDLLNAAKDGLVGMFGGISDKWGYVDAQGKYHTRTCFVAGTLVVTGDGFRPIEKIRAGDVVLSWNEKSGELGYNKVAQTFLRSTERIYQITFADGTFLETTWNHPFYIKGRGWVQAKDLRDGDLSVTAGSIRGDSRELRITSVIVDEREERVYNFEVSRDHTYFVGFAGVLVHNENYDPGVTLFALKTPAAKPISMRLKERYKDIEAKYGPEGVAEYKQAQNDLDAQIYKMLSVIYENMALPFYIVKGSGAPELTEDWVNKALEGKSEAYRAGFMERFQLIEASVNVGSGVGLLFGSTGLFRKTVGKGKRAGKVLKNSANNVPSSNSTNSTKKTKWDYINEWHDKRATDLFGLSPGKRNKEYNRTYDKTWKGRDIEYKSDNFSKRKRTQSELTRVTRQARKDGILKREKLANPHWHFEHDPRGASEMKKILEILEENNIPYTWGPNTPNI